MATKNSVTVNEISKGNATILVNEIKDGLAIISEGYLAITPNVAKLYDKKGFKALGYKNFDELCALEFGMSHGTTVGIRKVFKEFGTVDGKGEYIIKDELKTWGYTKLLLFATDKEKFESAGINPLEEFTPNDTIKDMRNKLASLLEDKSKAQEDNAIDTTSEEKTSEEKTSEDTTSEDTTATPLDLCNAIIEDVTSLMELTKDSTKPEKFAIIESVLASLKEYRKALK